MKYAFLLVGGAFIMTSLGMEIKHELLRREDYSLSRRDETPVQFLGNINQNSQVDPGVTVWLTGLGPHNIFGNLNNSGNIIFSQTDFLDSVPNNTGPGLVSAFAGANVLDGNLNNYGAISLNGYGSLVGSQYVWNLNTMNNTGSLQMCGRGDTGGSAFQITCVQTCHNYGIIDMEQYYGSLGFAFFWQNTIFYGQGQPVQANIYNEGTFRLVNVDFQALQNVLGTGCWYIGSNSTLFLQDGTGYLQNPGYGSTFAGQNIYFGAASATLHLQQGAYIYNPNFGANLYNFGVGHAIEFVDTLSSSAPYSYDTQTGILTAIFRSGYQVRINLGYGYRPTLFSSGTHVTPNTPAGVNAIFYNGPAPAQAVPSTCVASLGVCQDPINTVGALATATPISSASATSTQSRTEDSTTMSALGPFTTETLAYTGSQTLTGAITQTIAQATGTQQGTVVVYTPVSSMLSRPSILATTLGQASCVCVPAPF